MTEINNSRDTAIINDVKSCPIRPCGDREGGGKGFKKNWGKNINKYDIYEQTFQT